MKPTNEIDMAIKALNQQEILSLEPAYENLDYLKGLNQSQRIAATREEGNYLVIAGPGTGKTHTLVYRVYHLIKQGVDPATIVIITFTRKAGNVLKYRLQNLIPNTNLGFVGTFHAFAHHISQMVGSESPISKFRLLDSEDDIAVHKLVLAEFNQFGKSVSAKTLQKLISYCANTGLSVEAYIKKFDMRQLSEDIEAIEAYRQSYDRYKVNHMLTNYDDMISLMSRYLERDQENKWTAAYDYLMIDEYQDTNQMQLDFIQKLQIKNVMAIGDDFQGIYAFRGADHRIILNFYNDFKNPKMIKLTQNYRSTPRIIDWTNQTIERSQLGYHKTLMPGSQKEGSTKVVSGASLESHKQFIIDHIKKNPSRTHALIYRFNKNKTVFEKALIAENIEYVVYGGIRLLERKHVKDLLSFFMVYLNRRDVVGYNRILTLLPGIGVKTAKRLIKTDMASLDFLKSDKREWVQKVKDILTFNGEKEALFDEVTAFYFSIYENIESDYYTKEEILEDFKLVRELLETHERLENFVVNIILEPSIDLKKGSNPKVVLTTIHSAKGLEFDCVYYFHTHDWYKNYDLEALEEDRRLFYVGISRAKYELYIFDHTEIERQFEEIIRDFDSLVAPSPIMPLDESIPSFEDTAPLPDNVIKVDFGRGSK